MANADNTFTDRLARAQTLKGFIEDFTPAFAPGDSDINPVNFGKYLDNIEKANDALTTGETQLTNDANLRRSQADSIQTIALSVKDHVTSTRTWSKWHAPITKAADAVRGYSLPKKKVAAATTATPKKAGKSSSAQQGYADIDKLFGKLIEVVKKITGYTSAENSGLSVVELEAQRKQFQEQNEAVSKAETELSTLTDTRFSLYNDEAVGLKAKMKAIKKAVRSQYKAKSNEYAQVKGIRV